jgi:hypothetical protein
MRRGAICDIYFYFCFSLFLPQMRGRAICGLTTACEDLVGPALAKAQVKKNKPKLKIK